MKNIRIIGKVLLFLLVLATFTSCNKGVGCPMEFSVEPVFGVVKSILGIF